MIRSAATTAAISWETTYNPASFASILLLSQSPRVTAGLKWAPEMRINAVTITARTIAFASATPVSPSAPDRASFTTTDPPPIKTRPNVPMNSAVRGRSFTLMEISIRVVSF